MSLSDYQISELISFGFCDIGFGCIARVDRLNITEMVAGNWERYGLGRNIASMTPDQIEHCYRKYLATDNLYVGIYSQQFPDSRHAHTLYIKLTTDQSDFIDRIPDQIASMAEETKSHYLAEALF